MALLAPRCPRGTRDFLPKTQKLFNFILEQTKEVVSSFGYEEVSIPIFEYSDLYQRALGDVTDIITKEVYSFVDKGGEENTLRPEFTAGIARAIISNKLFNQLPIKWFSYGPLFRYERPQKGRFRQFHQLNFEYIGEFNEKAEIDIIQLIVFVLQKLGLLWNIRLELNSLGCVESRNMYRGALVEYLEKYESSLSELSKIRLRKNPLRVLDSKEKQDKDLLSGAPIISDYYTTESAKFFDDLKLKLSDLSIEFVENPLLVRGLDYYRHTVFEFTTENLGSQNAIAAGGRYDGLFYELGGKEVPAVGCAVGIERIMELLNQGDLYEEIENRALFLIVQNKEYESFVLSTMMQLRKEDIYVEYLSAKSSVSKNIQLAVKKNAKYIIVIGEDEKKTAKFSLKNLDNGQIEEFDFTTLIQFLKLS